MTAATGTSLTLVVPAGATTGVLVVTTPSGTATSASPFRVLGGIVVSPSEVNLSPGAVQPFQAAEGGSATTNVHWRVNGLLGGNAAVGTITPAGVYTAPANPPPQVLVTATHRDDPQLSGAALVGFVPAQPVFAGARAVTVRLDEGTAQAMALPATARIDVAAAQSTALAVSLTLEPVIAGLSPAAAPAGATALTVTLSGAGFTDATAVSVLRDHAPDPSITAASLVVQSDTQATVEVTVAAGAPLGGRVVRITTPGATSTAFGTGGNAFTVE